MAQYTYRSLLLSGRVVTADGEALQRYLLIRDGRIVWMSRSCPPEALVADAEVLATGPKDWIFPGLLDLHNHAAYNLLPLWHSPNAPFNNRFEWRSDAGYKAAISGTLNQISGLDSARKAFSELQAITGGTTLLDQPSPLDSNDEGHGTVLTRDTGSAADLWLAAGTEVRSVVDFFAPDKAGRPVPKPGFGIGPSPIDAYVADRNSGKLAGILVHVAEGRSGAGSNRGVDPYSRAEFEALMAHPAMQDAEAVASVPFTIVHGCGIDVRNPQHLQFLTDRKVSIVWSPVSNFLLYGDTLEAEALIQAGVNVALGSDWSPSGSKHVWEEAKFARFYLNAIGSKISDADVFRMVTTSAARCLGLQRHGRIEEGAPADLFILRSPIESDNALEIFFSTDDRDVVGTMVGGVPMYGDESFLTACKIEHQSLPHREGSAVQNKRVHLPAALGVNLEVDVDRLEDAMKALKPPVLRSNLLASSDTPYQRRLQFLRSRIEQFGWAYRRWAKKGAETPGEVRVAPNAVRVWCGVHNGGIDRSNFLEQLGQTLIPCTVQIMKNLGLTAYIPAIPEESKPPGVPDLVALEFYESQQVYRDAASSVAGRARALLHSAVFGAGASWSTFPEAFAGRVTVGSAYHLFTNEVDWYRGLTRVCLVVPRDGQSADDFQSAVADICGQVQSARPPQLDAALVAVTDTYAVFWDHRAAPQTGDDAHLEALSKVTAAVMCTVATDVKCNADVYERWNGVPAKGSDCMNVVFERRRLVPW